MSDKMNDLCCPNYEAEYERLMCEREKYISETEMWREIAGRAEKENTVLRAKVEMVELIFGGRNK